MRLSLRFLFLMVPILLFSCLDPGDIEDLQNPTDVDERFEDSIKGDTKQPDLPSRNTDRFSFLWVTDMHFRTGGGHYLKELGLYAEEVGARFIVTSGDLADNGLEEEYEYINVEVREWIEPYNLYFISALGNHDLSGDGWDAFKEHIGPSVFTFNYGNTLIIFIDTGNATVGRKQMDWIEEQLEESNKEHKVMLSHFPLYDGTVQTPTLVGDPDERYKLMYLCDEYGVEYFLAGHKHSIEEHEIGDTYYLMGGMASKKGDPINGGDVFWRFDIDGDDIDHDKVFLDDLDY